MKIIKNKKINLIKPNHYEKIAWLENRLIIGVDEVGRGCLAGPVVTCAVILKPNSKHKLLKDSKTLNKKELLIAYDWIKKNSHSAISFIDHKKIDQINIYYATILSMKRSVIQLLTQVKVKPYYILVDAMPLKLHSTDIEVKHFNFGETLSTSIAAASIVAKVTRDMAIERMNNFIPGYDLNKHKGYSTPQHKKNISKHSYSIIHRISFLQNLILVEEKENQTILFTEPQICYNKSEIEIK